VHFEEKTTERAAERGRKGGRGPGEIYKYISMGMYEGEEVGIVAVYKRPAASRVRMIRWEALKI